MMESAWSLHPQLAADTVPIGDLALSRVLLANDANYPWLILVPRRPGLTEIIDLDENEQVQLLGEIDAAARVLKSVTECEKLNIAALGNHGRAIARACHCTPAQRRRLAEAGVGRCPRPSAYNPAVRDGLIGALRRGLQIEQPIRKI